MSDTDNETSKDTVSDDGIFLRASDRRRFDYVMRALRENSLSLTLSSDNEGVLDHYGRLVLARLRKIAGLQIEVFLPQNTEQLLERFNQILAGISLEDSRKAEGSPAPRRALIANDAKALGKREMQLLARLIQDFPGANVSLVFLIDRAGMQLHEHTLDSFGQRLLRWPVEAPSRAEGEALLKTARSMGFEVEVKKVLAATGFTAQKNSSTARDEPAAGTDATLSPFEAQLALAQRERRELGHASSAATGADGQAHPKRRTHSDGRTEPTLDGQPPVPPPQPDTPVPPAGHSRLSTFLRWTLASILMLLLSASVVAMLFAPSLPPHVVHSPLLKQLLPPWAVDAVMAMTDKTAAVAPASVPPAAVDSNNEDVKPVAADDAAAVEAAPAAEAETPAAKAATVPADALTPAASAAKLETNAQAASAEAAKAEAAIAEPSKTLLAKAGPDNAALAKADADKAALLKADAAKAALAKADADKAALLKADAAKAALAKADADKAALLKADAAKAAPAKPANAAEALAPRSERGADAAIRAAPAGSFAVQHASLDSMAEAQEWRAQYRALSRARIVAVSTQDKGIKFAVVSGPFTTRKDAEVFSAREGVPPSPWLRPLKSLRAALLPASP